MSDSARDDDGMKGFFSAFQHVKNERECGKGLVCDDSFCSQAGGSLLFYGSDGGGVEGGGVCCEDGGFLFRRTTVAATMTIMTATPEMM